MRFGAIRYLAGIGLISLGLTACGSGAVPTHVPQPSSTAALASSSAASPSPGSSSNTASTVPSCPSWVVRDAHIAATAPLPVPTTELQGFLGFAIPNAQAIALWMGDAPTTPSANLLAGWDIHGMTASNGRDTTLTVAQQGSATLITIWEKVVTAAQGTAFQQDMSPAPAPAGPVRFSILVPGPLPAGSLSQVLATLSQRMSTNSSAQISVVYLLSTTPARAYETYGGPYNMTDLLQNGCGQLTAAQAPTLANRVIRNADYESIVAANGISIGFAPGAVVIATEHAGIVLDWWYAEPSITVPPSS
ncbi:MAG: hypothetical protein ACP5QO_16395 [Clostridia bacterium]